MWKLFLMNFIWNFHKSWRKGSVQTMSVWLDSWLILRGPTSSFWILHLYSFWKRYTFTHFFFLRNIFTFHPPHFFLIRFISFRFLFPRSVLKFNTCGCYTFLSGLGGLPYFLKPLIKSLDAILRHFFQVVYYN